MPKQPKPVEEEKIKELAEKLWRDGGSLEGLESYYRDKAREQLKADYQEQARQELEIRSSLNKPVWQWLVEVIIPYLAILVFAVVVVYKDFVNSQIIRTQIAKQDLLEYKRQMLNLILKEELLTKAKANSAELKAAKSLTSSTIKAINSEQNRDLTDFLTNMGLLQKGGKLELLAENNLVGANLSRANLSNGNLKFANLSGADLSRANLGNGKLKFANLSFANLNGANLSRADFKFANLLRADLSRANLSFANLSFANLNVTNLYGSDLSRANFSRANLNGANLSFANLNGANLYGSDLSRADLSAANLEKADFRSKEVTGVGVNIFRIGYSTEYFGEIVTVIYENTPASKTDIKLGDRITKINGKKIEDIDLREIDKLLFDKPGTQVTLTIKPLLFFSKEKDYYLTSERFKMSVQGLTSEKIKKAKNWEQAYYDLEFRQQLGLSPESTEVTESN